MAEKPKVALYWCASCGGCEEAVVDLAEDLLAVAEKVDIVFWPVAVDFKRKDVEALPDGSIAASLINGAVRLSEQEEMVKLLRKKSQYVIAYGACACWGGIPALANFYSKKQILDWVYRDAFTVENPQDIRPQEHAKVGNHEVEVPKFYHTVKALDQVIDVDYYIPGCPPTPKWTLTALTALLEGKLPPKGTVIAGDKALCHECPLNDTKPEQINIEEFKRPYEVILDREKCYLAQGVPCMGPITRGGCEALCVKGGMPCTGCFGPLDNIKDVGAKAVAALAASVVHKDEEQIEKALEGISDPGGTFYRYTLAKSMFLRAAEDNKSEGGE